MRRATLGEWWNKSLNGRSLENGYRKYYCKSEQRNHVGGGEEGLKEDISLVF